MIKTISIALLGFLFITYPAYAIESPSLISPANNSITSSIPTFSWQTVSGSTGYNILIDDEPTVTSPYAKTPYYPTNPSYSPQTLNPGTYYWKVKAKNSNGDWGSFSSIWSFTLASSNPNPTPIPTPNSTTSPTQSPSPFSSSSSTSSFIISGTPSQVNSNRSFTVSVNLFLANNPDTNFYLKGAFKTSDGSNYFGLTKVGSSWVKNGNAYSAQFPITTDSSGNWSGNLEMQPDSSDSGFIGTSDYIFKVGRYSTSGSGPTWSNGQTIKIIGESNSNSSGSSSSNSSNSSTTPTSSPKNPTTKTASITNSTVKINNKIASIAGMATSSASNSATPSAEVKAQKQINFIPWIGGLFILSGISSLIYMYLRAKKNA